MQHFFKSFLHYNHRLLNDSTYLHIINIIKLNTRDCLL